MIPRNTQNHINRPNPRPHRKHKNEILVLRRINRIHDDAVSVFRRRENPNVRRLRSGLQFGYAENVGAVFSRGPNQFDTLSHVGDVLVAA
ncbi:hypothetical protein D3C80_1448010 [compost metagenome]